MNLQKRHCVLCAAHPSPLSAYKGFLGCHHFSLANQFLVKHNLAPIDWSQLPWLFHLHDYILSNYPHFLNFLPLLYSYSSHLCIGVLQPSLCMVYTASQSALILHVHNSCVSFNICLWLSRTCLWLFPFVNEYAYLMLFVYGSISPFTTILFFYFHYPISFWSSNTYVRVNNNFIWSYHFWSYHFILQFSYIISRLNCS